MCGFDSLLRHQSPAAEPGVRIPRLPKDNERDRICSRDEYERLIEAAAPQLRLAVVVAYYAGMRLREIAKLTWEHIDLKERVFKLKSSETKARESRIVPITAPVLERYNTIDVDDLHDAMNKATKAGRQDRYLMIY